MRPLGGAGILNPGAIVSMDPQSERAQQDEEDLRLVEQARAGSVEAFASLFRRHGNRVYSITLGILRDEVEAQDAVQETFLQAWRRLDLFREESAFRSWLSRIATNASLMRLRTRRRHPEEPLEPKGPSFQADGHFERPVVDWSPLAERALENQELGQQLRAAVDKLPENYRMVLMLSDFEHRSMREIAEDLELSVPAVKTRLHRARLALREELAAYLDGRI